MLRYFALSLSLAACAWAAPVSLIERLDPVVYIDFETSPDDLPQEVKGRGALLQLKDNSPDSGVERTLGPVGSAWDFSATNDALIVRSSSVQGMGDIIHDEGFSVVFWLRHDSPNNARVLGSGYGKQLDIQTGYEGSLAVLIGQKRIDLPRTSALSDGGWHHVAVTLDFRSERENYRVYIDGELSAVESAAFDDPFTVARSDHSLFLGARANGGNANHLRGALDEVALFDRALSADEVAAVAGDDGSRVEMAIPKVDVGSDIARAMDDVTVELTAEVEGVDLADESTVVQWVQLSGSGEVSFSRPRERNTLATFTPDPASDYDTYRLRCIVRTADARRHDDVQVSFTAARVPAMRSFAKLPPAGVHPRLLFTPNELPAMRANFAASPHAQAAARYLLGELERIRASDATYQKLVAGEGEMLTFTTQEALAWFSKIGNAAAVALMKDDGVLLNELAAAASTLADAYEPIYRANYDDYLVGDTSEFAALTYDFLFHRLTESGRANLRKILARMSRHRVGYGSFKKPWEINGNWDTYHDMPVLCALAIEGELGYDARVAEAAMHKLRSYFSGIGNGIHREGFGHEGDGYVNFGMERGSLSMLALAYRGENLFGSSRFYQNTRAKFREIQPWRGGQMYSHHDGQAWGTGFHTGSIFWITQHVFPTDPLADYVAQTFAATFSEDRKKRVACVLFSRPPLVKDASPKAVATAADLPLSAFEKERGLVNARSDWSEDALRLDFECRMDLYSTGHLHSDRNMFTLSALGRQWITDQGYHETSNDMHATVLIDGFGQPGSAAYRWKGMPGVFVDYADDGDTVTMCGDARIAYSYHSDGARRGGDDAELPEHIAAVLDAPAEVEFTWADFVLRGTDAREIAGWKSRSGPSARRYNPVQKAFRTAMLVRGEHPYVIVVDDIQLDDRIRLYDWCAPLASDTAVNPGRTTLVSASATQAILRFEKDMALGSPRLLVRVIQAEGEARGDIGIDARAIGVYAEEKGLAPTVYDMLSIKRRTSEPKFKVLLYPFRAGEELPETVFDSDRLVVNLPDGRVDQVTFSADAADGRSVLEWLRVEGR